MLQKGDTEYRYSTIVVFYLAFHMVYCTLILVLPTTNQLMYRIDIFILLIDTNKYSPVVTKKVIPPIILALTKQPPTFSIH